MQKKKVVCCSVRNVTIAGKEGSLMALAMLQMGKESKCLPVCTLM